MGSDALRFIFTEKKSKQANRLAQDAHSDQNEVPRVHLARHYPLRQAHPLAGQHRQARDRKKKLFSAAEHLDFRGQAAPLTGAKPSADSSLGAGGRALLLPSRDTHKMGKP